MSRLLDRINGLKGGQDADENSNNGVPTLPKDGKDYRAPRAIPLARIITTPGLLAYDDSDAALLTADGALIPATGPKQWGQLYAAGRA
jgi:hypothetical protein